MLDQAQIAAGNCKEIIDTGQIFFHGKNRSSCSLQIAPGRRTAAFAATPQVNQENSAGLGVETSSEQVVTLDLLAMSSLEVLRFQQLG